jgi:hypothetical protein
MNGSARTDDWLLLELSATLSAHAGPDTPAPKPRLRRGRHGLTLTVALAAVVCAAAATAASLGLFGSTPAPPSVTAQLAAQDDGAPPALDPMVEPETAGRLISISTASGTVTLIVARASRADWCAGLEYSWLEGAGVGCTGPGGTQPPITVAVSIPGVLGHSPAYIWGRVAASPATTLRLDFADGTQTPLPLSAGFFLYELDPDTLTSHGRLVQLVALGDSNTEIASVPGPMPGERVVPRP